MRNLKEKRKQKEAKGITLIALVITIIVLLILAGVSIATLTGNNGILNQAQKAKEETKIATEEEQRQLAMAEAATNLEGTKYQGIPIPAGMAPTRIEGESTVEEGLVVIDKNGNEWVWIEVPREIYEDERYNSEAGGTIGATDFDKIEKVLRSYTQLYGPTEDNHRQDCKDVWSKKSGINFVEEYTELYNSMLRSVFENGGFYIGRYEAGIAGTRGVDAESLSLGRIEENQNDRPEGVICQKDAIPYNLVRCAEAQMLASQLSPTRLSTSSLMFGIQWDLVLKFIEEKEVSMQGENKRTEVQNSIKVDSFDWGNYKNQMVEISSKCAKIYSNGKWSVAVGNKLANQSAILSTGSSDETKELNIYDLAGNEWEYTLEQDGRGEDGEIMCRGGECREPKRYLSGLF